MKKIIRYVINTVLILILLFAVGRFTYNAVESSRNMVKCEEALSIATGNPDGSPAVSEAPQEEQAPPAEAGADTAAPPESADETGADVPAEEAPEEIPIPDDPYIQELLTYDLNALREENEDVIGWIMIPDTNITFPLLQWTDNDFYLSHSWQQSPNGAGSIFMEWQNDPAFTDFNTIIYGHNMNRTNMFGKLHSYRNATFAQEHPHVYIRTDYGVYRYDLFAGQRANIDSVIYGVGQETDYRKEELIRFSLDYSVIETEVVPTVEDQLLTLSTCSGQGYTTRWVVQFVLNRDASYIVDEPLP